MHRPYEITYCVNHSQQAFPWELYNTRDYYCISAVSVHVIRFYSIRDLRLVTLVAENGSDPSTSGLWAQHASTEALMPIGFTLLDKFHSRRLLPGESLSLFSHELKKLLEHAMPEIDQKTRDQLLLHQFVAGLPVQVSKQLRAVGATTELKSTVQRAKLLMSLEEQQPVAAITPTDPKRTLAEGTMNVKFDSSSVSTSTTIAVCESATTAIWPAL